MTQATNLEQSINLYCMDANENVEMLVGDANKTFPDGGSTGLGSGYGNNMNQYTWQTAVHEGKMYLSTMNTTTLLEPIAQFTNGDILHMSAQEWKDTVKYLRAFLEILLKRDDTAAFSRTRSVRPAQFTNGDILHMSAQEWKDTVKYLRAFLEILLKRDDTAAFSRTRSVRPSADDPDALVEWACRQASERAAADTPAQIDGDGGTQEEVALTDAQRESLVKGIKDGGIVPESLDDANTAGELFAINGALSSLAPQLDEQASEGFVDSYGDLLAALGALPQVPENLKKLYETLLKLASKQNMQAFFKSLPYLAKSKRGFNLALGALPQVPENLKKLYETLLKLASKQNMQAFFKSLPYLAKSKRGFNLFEIALPQVPENLKKLYETLLKLASKQNMQAFFKSLPYLAKSKRGFNLFEISEDAQGGVAVASDNTFVMPSHSNRAGLHRQQHLCGRQPAVGRPRVHRCIDHRPGDGRGSRHRFGSHDDRRQAQARLTCAP